MADDCKAADYVLTIDQENPTRGIFRLSLNTPLGSSFSAFTRHQGGTNVREPRCENTKERLIQSGSEWIVPEGCSTIVWETQFVPAEGLDVNLSQQKNIYHPNGWWLYSEWGSLLRIAGREKPAKLCARVRGSEVCREVPETSQPPLLLPIGEPETTRSVDGAVIRLFTGNLPSSFQTEQLFRSYEGQLQYLRTIISESVGAPMLSVIDIVILGIDISYGRTGGAAGYQSLLTNVVIEDGEIEASEEARLLWVTGHEMAHLLGLGTEALWASESLAHYYGYKSVEDIVETTQLFWQMPLGSSEIGLIEANRRVGNGQRQYYGLFYSKGAHFWRTINELISSGTDGQSSLDDYLPLLVDGGFGDDGELPREFIEHVGRAAGKGRLSRVLQEYL
jgi:hypothetical protein